MQALNEEADCGNWHFKEAKGRSWHLMGSWEWKLLCTGLQKAESGKLQGSMNRPSEKPAAVEKLCPTTRVAVQQSTGHAWQQQSVSYALQQAPAMPKVVYSHQQERCASTHCLNNQ